MILGKKKPVTVFLSEEDFQMLDSLRKEKDRSISSLIREAVKEWLKKNRGN